LKAGVCVRRVRRADFLTIETPLARPSSVRLQCPEFSLKALFRFAKPLLFTERIFSTVQTCKMQSRVAYDFVHEAVQSWLGHLQPHSLMPEHIHLQHPA
jgi:hypothetical protein